MQKIISLFKYYSDKRFSTISGTLVYFLLMSTAPFFFWLTLFVGNLDLERFMSNEIFAAVGPIIGYLKESAESATSGAGIILLATSLYSSTNFFYHLRRSGEIIYGNKRKKGGLRLRLSALAIIAVTIVCVAVIAAIPAFGSRFLSGYIPQFLSQAISYIFITFVALAVAVLLNIFACPYKLGIKYSLSGSLLTTALWLILATGFSVYLRFANPTRLYGKIASLIIFLLWCYIMINCLVIGIIYNQKYLTEREVKKMF